MGLEVLDNVLGLGVGDDKLEANEVFVLASRTNGGEKVTICHKLSLKQKSLGYHLVITDIVCIS